MPVKRRPRLRSTFEDVGKAQLPILVARSHGPEEVEVVYSEYRVRLRGGAALGQQVFAKTGLGEVAVDQTGKPPTAMRTRRFVL
ncbi:hypothetical protein [Shimia sp.]|uniref:hypothetical protein n=1 Tax=unclassified Shimia TaxID=2630038 RepID=UPI0025D87F23|nr:hypothetical protein [Shimia sp.]MCH2066188.1 hypothetical protein [Shimia sp.]